MSRATHIRFLARERARTTLAEKCEHEVRLLQQISSLQDRIDNLTLKFATVKEKNCSISERVAALTETNRKQVPQIRALEAARHEARSLEEENRELMKRLEACESDPEAIAAQRRKQRQLRESLEQTGERLTVARMKHREQRSLIFRLKEEKESLAESVEKWRLKAEDSPSAASENREQETSILELREALEASPRSHEG